MGISDDGVEPWDEIHGFGSLLEYERFESWLADAIGHGFFVEVDVDAPYSGSNSFEQRWVRDSSGVVWRLVAPDAPFPGVFEKVNAEELKRRGRGEE